MYDASEKVTTQGHASLKVVEQLVKWHAKSSTWCEAVEETGDPYRRELRNRCVCVCACVCVCVCACVCVCVIVYVCVCVWKGGELHNSKQVGHEVL